MYPPLCFTDATCCEFPEESQEILERQLTEAEYLSLRRGALKNANSTEISGNNKDTLNDRNDISENTKPVKIKFKLLELLNNR